MNDTAVLEALGATVAVIGGEVSEVTIRIMAAHLESYPMPRVLAALARCQLECKYRLSLADVIERMVDGHPGPDEAWELVPKTEGESAVLTQEIAASIPFGLLACGDLIAARMAFRESYTVRLRQARSEKRDPQWFASLGHQVDGRARALANLVEMGRISSDYAHSLLPPPEQTGGRDVLALAGRALLSFPAKPRKMAL